MALTDHTHFFRTGLMLFSYRIAAIVGLAIGGVLLLIFLISCICCIYCFYKNKKARTSGGVVNPATNSNSVFGKIHLIQIQLFKTYTT